VILVITSLPAVRTRRFGLALLHAGGFYEESLQQYRQSVP
jgi:hypothetical protein